MTTNSARPLHSCPRLLRTVLAGINSQALGVADQRRLQGALVMTSVMWAQLLKVRLLS